MSRNIVITIARQYGSAGLAIGEHLARTLSINLYDKELITMSAQKNNMSPEVLKGADEKSPSSLLYTLALGSSVYSDYSGLSGKLPLNDKLFIAQSEIIKELAVAAPCVIVGRCADYVLRDFSGRISIFLYADIEFRKQQVMDQKNLSASQALELINKTDRRRMNYYNFYTGCKWGKRESYNLSIDSSILDAEGTADTIANYARIYAKKKNCFLPDPTT